MPDLDPAHVEATWTHGDPAEIEYQWRYYPECGEWKSQDIAPTRPGGTVEYRYRYKAVSGYTPWTHPTCSACPFAGCDCQWQGGK